MNSESIPVDLLIEILSRLPEKSVARFNCVSKLWASILGHRYFKQLFLTRSSAQPRLLFAVQEDGVCFFSLPQRQSSHDKSSTSLIVAAEFHVKFPREIMEIYHYSDRRYFSCGYTSGLIYFYGCRNEGRPLICNPNTGRYATLPYLKSYRKSYSFFGLDPIEKQFKVLFMPYPTGPGHHKILTLGIGRMKWRKIKCSLRPDINSEGICINGVLYFLGDTFDLLGYEKGNYMVVCFDIRSEKFKFIEVDESFFRLINYKDKLGMISWGIRHQLHFWVLEDVEKQEWSKNVYTLKDDDKFLFCHRKISIVGGTAMGEIVLTMDEYKSKEPFYVFYFNPERNTLQCVEIQGFGEYYHQASKNCRVLIFVNHVEDLNVNDAKLLTSSIYAPYVKTEKEEEESSSSSSSSEEEE